MEFRELVSPSLTDLFVEEMEHLILSGRLKAGEKLPTERELSAQMKISLSVVSSGIQRLADHGFVRVLPRQGAFVTDYVGEGNLNTLQAILAYGGDYFDPALNDAIIEFRKVAEVKIAEGACKCRSAESIERLEAAVTQLEQAETVPDQAEAAFGFHHRMAVDCGNLVYPCILMTFKPFYLSGYKSLFELDGTAKTVDYFNKIIRAVHSNNVERTINTSFENIEYGHKLFRQTFWKGEKLKKPEA